MIDPPWPMNGKNPTRGPRLLYDTVNVGTILNLKIENFQEEGLVFIWVINAVYVQVMKWLIENEYQICKELHWVKVTKHGKLAVSMGYYLQHATETCIVAYKNCKRPKFKDFGNNHVIFAPRRLQSQKPEALYKIVEKVANDSKKAELFGRSVNLRKDWTTFGIQVIPNEKECWIFLKEN